MVFDVIGIKPSGEKTCFEVQATETEREYRVVIPAEKAHDLSYLRVESNLTCAEAGEDGYMFYPTDFVSGVMLTHFTPRCDSSIHSLIAAMPVAGIGQCERAVMIQVLSPVAQTRFFAQCRENRYSLSPEIVLDGRTPEQDIVVLYRRMPFATYVDMAHAYREYQLTVGKCVPLRERVKGRTELSYAASSMELRIRMGWKPVPPPLFRQNDGNEPPLKVVVDIDKLNRIVDGMKERGIDKAELCLVGWGKGGHDGRFPQQIPSSPEYGGDEALKAFIARAQEMGYQVVCHTNSVCAYEVADNWDVRLVTHHLVNGLPHPEVREGYVMTGGLSGGAPYHLCAQSAYDPYAVTDLPKVQKYGFKGLHFVDELTACAPESCEHPDHPLTRTESTKYYRKIAKLCKELFGGFQSESWMDFMNSDVDYVMYTSARKRSDPKANPIFDEDIPFWQLVYHGIVLFSPSSSTVNYPLKEKDERLRMMEYGARPLMYYYSKFGEAKNWMGDIDLRCGTDEEFCESMDALKAAYDDMEETLAPLQYAFMDNHEKLGENRYRSTFSDGTVIEVDYEKGTCDILKGNG